VERTGQASEGQQTRQELQAQFGRLVERLDQLRLLERWDQESLRDTLRTAMALQAFLIANGATMGECRQEYPTAPLRPVIDEDGNLKWCCTHKNEHCAG
jgi:hypothetical protein